VLSVDDGLKKKEGRRRRLGATFACLCLKSES